MEELLKLLDLVRRDLEAEDAWAQVGGSAIERPQALELPLGEWRVVVTFASPPEDPDAKRAKLEALLEPFVETVSAVEPPLSGSREKQLALDAELDALAERAGARAALVVDERSPVLWGCSAPRADGWDVFAMEEAHQLARAVGTTGGSGVDWIVDGAPDDEALTRLGVDETKARRWSHRAHRMHDLAPGWSHPEWAEALQIATAVTAARAQCKEGVAPERYAAHEDGWGVFVRGFAQIYMLVLIYDGAYSELHAEGPLLRALPHIENLVLSLPPVEPPPRGAKVIALRPR